MYIYTLYTGIEWFWYGIKSRKRIFADYKMKYNNVESTILERERLSSVSRTELLKIVFLNRNRFWRGRVYTVYFSNRFFAAGSVAWFDFKRELGRTGSHGARKTRRFTVARILNGHLCRLSKLKCTNLTVHASGTEKRVTPFFFTVRSFTL